MVEEEDEAEEQSDGAASIMNELSDEEEFTFTQANTAWEASQIVDLSEHVSTNARAKLDAIEEEVCGTIGLSRAVERRSISPHVTQCGVL